MTQYDVLMSPFAKADIAEIGDYITKTLLAPETARTFLRSLVKEIDSLSQMPARIRPIDRKPWNTYGIRRLLVKNFYIYYTIDEDKRHVYVLNIIYSKRDQLKQLETIKSTLPK